MTPSLQRNGKASSTSCSSPGSLVLDEVLEELTWAFIEYIVLAAISHQCIAGSTAAVVYRNGCYAVALSCVFPEIPAQAAPGNAPRLAFHTALVLWTVSCHTVQLSHEGRNNTSRP